MHYEHSTGGCNEFSVYLQIAYRHAAQTSCGNVVLQLHLKVPTRFAYVDIGPGTTAAEQAMGSTAVLLRDCAERLK